ncbi:MAG: hypothetical protein WEG36_01605 [Gemmatimonadota bacterium]
MTESGAENRGSRSGVPFVGRGLIEVELWSGLGIGRVEGGRLIEGERGLRQSAGGGKRRGLERNLEMQEDGPDGGGGR